MSKQLLIIDDDPDFVAMNKAVLENAGYQVATASNAQEGLQAIKEKMPDLVMIDVMMGSDVAGFNAVEEIRALPGGDTLPIIMITSFDQHHKAAWTDKPDRAWVNVDNYLKKPVSPDDLIAEVSKHLK